ncbi:MAG: carboxypeptidase-like regulatory domain-containing protein [Pyrinomonadaceae bacterium]
MKIRKIVIVFLALLFLAASVSAQSGGGFEITQSVIASGGGQNSASGAFSLDGTIGQSLAGNALTGNPFAVTSGFWNFTPLAPTAASVTIGGYVRTAGGRGIRNVRVTLTAPSGETQFAATSLFGYYHFDNTSVGETYIISVYAKRYTFAQPTIIRTVLEEVNDLDFVADSF